MSERIHALAYRLFGKSSIDECGLQDIRTLAERYPYFAPAQFLLLEKLKRTGSEEYQAQSQKAVLYYHNPIEFEQFISSDRFYTELDLEDSFIQPFSPGISEENREASGDDLVIVTEIVTEDIEEGEEIPPPPPEPQVKSEDVIEETETVTGTDREEETVTETETEREEEETIPMATEPEVMSEDMAIAEDIIQPEATEPEHEEAPSMKAIPTEEAEHEEVPTMQASPVEKEERPVTEAPSTPLPSASLPSTSTPSTEEPLAFEPFHTVDYFASQGIKLSQEEAGSGKFGKQLKSFTEWLRTMKRLPPPEISARLDRSSEKTVQNLAEGSVNDADIVTEAMAEVWIKQGKPEKALEVYNKLSLLNPSKKAYFAAKIDNLKR